MVYINSENFIAWVKLISKAYQDLQSFSRKFQSRKMSKQNSKSFQLFQDPYQPAYIYAETLSLSLRALYTREAK